MAAMFIQGWLGRIQERFQAAADFWQRCAWIALSILVLIFGGSLASVIYAASLGERFWWFPYAFLMTFGSVIGLSLALVALIYLYGQTTQSPGTD